MTTPIPVELPTAWRLLNHIAGGLFFETGPATEVETSFRK
jgi:hypothetical protein